MSKELGEKILYLLKSRNMSQKELAERIGTTEATMSRYVAGERDPKSEVLANIATALNTTTDYLLGKEADGTIEKDFPQIKRLIARNAEIMTEEQKKELLSVLFKL